MISFHRLPPHQVPGAGPVLVAGRAPAGAATTTARAAASATAKATRFIAASSRNRINRRATILHPSHVTQPASQYPRESLYLGHDGQSAGRAHPRCSTRLDHPDLLAWELKAAGRIGWRSSAGEARRLSTRLTTRTAASSPIPAPTAAGVFEEDAWRGRGDPPRLEALD